MTAVRDAARRVERARAPSAPGLPVSPPGRVAATAVYESQAHTRWFMQHARQVLGSADLRGPAQSRPRPLPLAPRDLDGLRTGGEGRALGPTLAQVLRRTHTDGFLVLAHGAVVVEQYFGDMTPATPHQWQSMSKSLVSCVAGSVVAAGLLDTTRPVTSYVPELDRSAYAGALVEHLLDMQVGIDYSEDYDDPDSDVNELDRLYGLRPPRAAGQPGSTYDFARSTRPRGRHGERFDYVSLNVNVLAWVLERATGRWLPDLISDEIWSKLGGEHDAWITLDGAGSAQAESGVSSSLRDLARFGLALSRGGRVGNRIVVPPAWVASLRRGGDIGLFAATGEAAIMPDGSYRRCFWVAHSGGRSILMALGVYGQMLYVDPQADVVVAKFSTQPTADDLDYFRLDFALAERLSDVLA